MARSPWMSARFAAGTSAEVYEDALRAHGLPTYRATGRGYFGQQQVVDLLAYLRLLHNRYDDEALVTVLASPLVGVSNDALVLLRQAAGRRPLFSGLEREPPPFLSWEDTVNIPPKATVRIAWMPDDRPGEWMYHCHILEHHASGMMAHFEVVR